MDIQQGDIYWVTITPSETKGSEQYGCRPFIIVSRLAINRAGKTVVAVPMSTAIQGQPAYRIALPVAEISKDLSCTDTLSLSVAKTDQVRVIDKSRLGQKIGRLSQTATIAVIHGLAFVFDIR